ncbi:MAG TPA: hypothetical protein VK674_02885 [Candidatus Limnocylindria bacterium]|nr:hypothetical protein [Candidatus Limnocylindria bacterium]
MGVGEKIGIAVFCAAGAVGAYAADQWIATEMANDTAECDNTFEGKAHDRCMEKVEARFHNDYIDIPDALDWAQFLGIVGAIKAGIDAYYGDEEDQ